MQELTPESCAGFDVRELSDDATSLSDALPASIESDFAKIAANPTEHNSGLCWKEICAIPRLFTFGVWAVCNAILFVWWFCVCAG
jgi:hypothetical protein